jgi:hypothetical protein
MDGLKSECLGGFRLEEVDGFVGIRTTALRCVQHRHEAGPVVLSRSSFNQVPSKTVANSRYPVPRQSLIVFHKEAVVLRRCEQVEPPPVLASMR